MRFSLVGHPPVVAGRLQGAPGGTLDWFTAPANPGRAEQKKGIEGAITLDNTILKMAYPQAAYYFAGSRTAGFEALT